MVTCDQRNRAAALHGTGAAASSIGAPNAAMQASQGLIVCWPLEATPPAAKAARTGKHRTGPVLRLGRNLHPMRLWSSLKLTRRAAYRNVWITGRRAHGARYFFKQVIYLKSRETMCSHTFPAFDRIGAN